MNRWTHFCRYLLQRHSDLSRSQPEGKNYLRLINQNNAHVALGHKLEAMTLRLVLNRSHWSEQDASDVQHSIKRRLAPLPSEEYFDRNATHGNHRWVVQLVKPIVTATAEFHEMERWYLERSFVFLREFAALQERSGTI